MSKQVEFGEIDFEAIEYRNDLTERRRLAMDRYLGYAKGTSLRQPERYLMARETLN
jgi:hypothetical protein